VSPGNEQVALFRSSAAADDPAPAITWACAGAASRRHDQRALNARERGAFVAAVRAARSCADVGHLRLIPLYHLPTNGWRDGPWSAIRGATSLSGYTARDSGGASLLALSRVAVSRTEFDRRSKPILHRVWPVRPSACRASRRLFCPRTARLR